MDSIDASLQVCPECAVEMPANSAFCPGCGRPMQAPERTQGRVGVFPERIAGALAYLSFLPAVVFLFLEPYKRNQFLRFHSWQSVIFCAATIAAGAAIRVLSLLLVIIPVVGPLVVSIAVVVAILAAIFLWLVLVVKAFQGVRFALPMIGNLADSAARSI